MNTNPGYLDYRTCTPDQLRARWRHYRNMAYNMSNAANMTTCRTRQGRSIANSWGYANRQCEMIEAIATKRRIPLCV